MVTQERARDADGFLVDVLEAFPQGENGVVCLTVKSNEDRDQHASQLMVAKDFGPQMPTAAMNAQEWIYSLARLPDGRLLTAQRGGLLRMGPAESLADAVELDRSLTKLCPAATGAFLIGLGGYVGFFDGVSAVDLPPTNAKDIHHVSQSPDGTVFACGPRGLLLRLGKAGWQPVDLGVAVNLNRIVAQGPEDVVLCGSRGFAGHYRDNELQTYETPDDRDYFCLGASRGRWYFGSGYAGLEVLDGNRVVPFEPRAYAFEIHGDDRALLVTGLNRLARYDGSKWDVANFN
jgi:hypothetical protein